MSVFGFKTPPPAQDSVQVELGQLRQRVAALEDLVRMISVALQLINAAIQQGGPKGGQAVELVEVAWIPE